MFFIHLDGREKITRKYLTGYKISFSFESFTGADIIITPLNGNISKENIQTHLNAGAVMIQVKHGRDLSDSIMDQRLFESLLRMNSLDAAPYQCGLLMTGDFFTIKGKLIINGKKSNINDRSYEGALRSWVIRGGVIWPIIYPENIQNFVDGLGSKLFVADPFVARSTARSRKKYKRATKTFQKGMSLREKARLSNSNNISQTDFRHTLVNFDGLSNKHVTEIWNILGKSGERNMQGFVDFVIEGRIIEVKGIGEKTQKKIMEQLGYDE